MTLTLTKDPVSASTTSRKSSTHSQMIGRCDDSRHASQGRRLTDKNAMQVILVGEIGEVLHVEQRISKRGMRNQASETRTASNFIHMRRSELTPAQRVPARSDSGFCTAKWSATATGSVPCIVFCGYLLRRHGLLSPETLVVLDQPSMYEVPDYRMTNGVDSSRSCLSGPRPRKGPEACTLKC